MKLKSCFNKENTKYEILKKAYIYTINMNINNFAELIKYNDFINKKF